MPRGPLYLTFDDGPDPDGTPAVLAALARHEVRATFFVLGARVREWPGIVGAVLGAGHRIELHGEAHLDHRGLTPAALIRDTDTALTAMRDAGIVLPQWWRLPWGRPGPDTHRVAAARDLRIIGWDADTHDWRGDGWADQPEPVQTVAREGGVVLMHDGFGPGQLRDDVTNTIGLIDGIMAAARAADVTVAALPPARAAAGLLLTDAIPTAVTA
jgi:peptidoglycan/xylan/chitin deacetylase (PgdA/CDA1 family)